MQLTHTMKHRHIDTQEFTLAAIDDIITRGGHQDWLELRDAINLSPEIAAKVKKICEHFIDLNDQNYNFWLGYLEYMKDKK